MVIVLFIKFKSSDSANQCFHYLVRPLVVEERGERENGRKEVKRERERREHKRNKLPAILS